MATLIGREAWHIGACLSHGKIVKHNLESNAVTINRGIGFGEIVVHSSQVLLTIEAALLGAEESIDYWDTASKKLRAEYERRENADSPHSFGGKNPQGSLGEESAPKL